MAILEHGIYYLEIVASDAEAARDFYSEAYGWEFEPMEPALGNAFVAVLPGGSRCGIRGTLSAQEQPIVRTYLGVANLDLAVEKASALGAMIAIERMEIPGHGTIAIYFIGGVEQGLWELP